MYNHVANRGRKALLKQIFSVLLIFTLYFNSFNSAWALTTVRDWSITNVTRQGATTNLSASKSIIIDGNVINKTSVAKITPTASQVAKILRGGAYGLVISVALEQILGLVVDWTLEPENNRISYLAPGSTVFQSSYAGMNYSIKYYSLTSLCSAALQAAKTNYQGATSYTTVGSSCRVNYGDTGAYDNVPYGTSQEQEQKRYVSLDTIADQVISNADSSDQDAQTATNAAADDALANDPATQADVSNQLDSNAKTNTNEQAIGDTTPKDPADPNAGDTIKLNFPVFCTWAPLVCEAAQTTINFPKTLTNWWTTATTSISDAWTWTKAQYEASVTSISDFFKNEPDQTDNTDLPVEEIPLPQLQTNAFTATAGCPEPIPIQIKIGVEGTAHISYEPICQFAEKWSFIAPLIGFLSGAMIIVGVGRKGEDSEI